MATEFDFSDARDIQLHSRHRNAQADIRLGHDLGWDADFIAHDCRGDGFASHPLLVAPGGWREQARAIAASGVIEGGRGIHRLGSFTVVQS
jgi:hypothetical protein